MLINTCLMRHVNLAQHINSLVIADENIDVLPPELKHCQVMTNQYDLWLRLKENEFDERVLQFSDFDFSKIDSGSLDQIIMRLPKSKPVCFHILNQSARVLKDSGELLLIGLNEEGIQTMIKHAAKRIGQLVEQKLEGKGIRFGRIQKKSSNADMLDDQQYSVLRAISAKNIEKAIEWMNENGHRKNTIRSINNPVNQILPNIVTKPGLYGFDKVDQGSSFLVETLWQYFENIERAMTLQALKLEQQRIKTFKQHERYLIKTGQKVQSHIVNHSDVDQIHPLKILDLGCGYGYLSLSFFKMSSSSENFPAMYITATDTNAAAVIACTENFQRQSVLGTVIADDCGLSLGGQLFDLILCNPPFHQGFDTSLALSNQFIARIKDSLHPNGQAWIVVNRFLQFEQLASAHQLACEMIRQNTQFRIFTLTHAKAEQKKTQRDDISEQDNTDYSEYF